MTKAPEVHGYAAMANGMVYAIGRSVGGMVRDLERQEADSGSHLEHFTTIACTRRAFDAIRAGRTDIDGVELFTRDGVLDAPKRPVGRPSYGERLESFAVRLPASLRARLRARARLDRCTDAEVFRKALEAFLEPPGGIERKLLRKLTKGGE